MILVFERKDDGIVRVGKMEIQTPGIGFVAVSRANKTITLPRTSKVSTHRAE